MWIGFFIVIFSVLIICTLLNPLDTDIADEDRVAWKHVKDTFIYISSIGLVKNAVLGDTWVICISIPIFVFSLTWFQIETILIYT